MKKPPAYRRQKLRRGHHRAFVELNEKRIYLGPYGTAESREAYDRVIAEWLANGRTVPVAPQSFSIIELADRYWGHVKEYYPSPDGGLSQEALHFKNIIKTLVGMFGTTAATEFGPLRLKAVRQSWEASGKSRPYINRLISRIKRMFRWAVSEELIPPATYQALSAVPGLKRGRTTAPETKGVKPVADAIVDATLAHLTPTMRTMVELQRLTGMRPGEVCQLRGCDVDTTGRIWIYRPERHKTAYAGLNREIFIGPKAQRVLSPWLNLKTSAFIFSPEQSERERLEKLHANRLTPMSCGNVPGSNVKDKPKRTASERWKPSAYRRAIEYACRKAFPPPPELRQGMARQPGETTLAWKKRVTDSGVRKELRAWIGEHSWHPHQLRHSFATLVRKSHGLDAAQVLLGHAGANVTEIYAELDRAKAESVIARVG